MSDAIEFCENRATVQQLAGHLQACDTDFMPPLNGRVVIGDYARKIADRALRFEAWADGELVGLVAAYCNDVDSRTAYVTSVSVLHGWQGRGIARQLLERCLEQAKTTGFRRIELEVGRENAAAIRLYEKLGFAVGQAGEPCIRMYREE